MTTRIASLLASGTEIVCGLGLADSLVAISHECNFPPEVLDRPRVTHARIDDARPSRDIDQQVKQLSTSGTPLYSVDRDALVELQPNLIITQSHCDVCAVSYDDVVAMVQQEPRLRAAEIAALNPTTLESTFADIMSVGKASGVTPAAERYVETLRQRVERIHKVAGGLDSAERARTIAIEWIDPVMVAANWMPDLIAIAGGECEITQAGKPSAYTDWSEVIAYNPEVIVVAPCGFGLGRTMEEMPALRGLPGWSDIAAVRSGRVNAADGNAYFNRSGPRLVDSVEILAHVLHPDFFAFPASAAPADAVLRKIQA